MLQSGDTVDSYVVVSPKGSGNFGHVFEVTETTSNESMALKLLTNRTGDNEVRFRAENGHLHTLKTHENVIFPKTIVIDTNGHIFYCMELADTSAQLYVTQNTLTNEEALKLFLGICKGMKHAHDKNIVHRDLHLGNVLLNVSGANGLSPKLTDFGMAKDFNATSVSYIPLTVWGAIQYWSPEIFFLIWQDAEVENYIRADIFALGVMLHTLLASDPILYRAGLIASIGTYLKGNNIVGNGGIQIASSLSLPERVRHFNQWHTAYNQANQTNLNVVLRQPDATLETEANRIIQKCCASDYNNRYMNVGELLQEINALC